MNESVLIVDNTAVIRKMISIALHAAGYGHIEEADDSTEALYKLKYGVKPTLIIADANMSHMDGMALTEKIRELPRHRGVPILAVTSSYGKSSTYTDPKKIGADAVIRKPFTVRELYEVVDNITRNAGSKAESKSEAVSTI